MKRAFRFSVHACRSPRTNWLHYFSFPIPSLYRKINGITVCFLLATAKQSRLGLRSAAHSGSLSLATTTSSIPLFTDDSSRSIVTANGTKTNGRTRDEGRFTERATIQSHLADARGLRYRRIHRPGRSPRGPRGLSARRSDPVQRADLRGRGYPRGRRA